MTRAMNFTDEIGKIEKIVQKDCGQEIRLIFISGPGLSMAHVANVTHASKDCVEKTILANLGSIHPAVQPALIGALRSLWIRSTETRNEVKGAESGNTAEARMNP